MTAPSVPTIPSSRTAPRRRALLGFVIVLAGLVGIWEGYKLLGSVTTGKIPFTTLDLPVRHDDASMPHVWQIVGALFEPAQRGGEPLALLLAGAAAVTFKGQLVIDADPGADAYRTDLATAAVTALEEEGLDTRGAGFQKTQVTLTEGGN